MRAFGQCPVSRSDKYTVTYQWAMGQPDRRRIPEHVLKPSSSCEPIYNKQLFTLFVLYYEKQSIRTYHGCLRCFVNRRVKQ
jgi:hypothetical protein